VLHARRKVAELGAEAMHEPDGLHEAGGFSEADVVRAMSGVGSFAASSAREDEGRT
jgi:hypothetical protein